MASLTLLELKAAIDPQAVTQVRDHGRMADIIFTAMHEAITAGRLAPGDWLRQEALAEEFGVSQNPVREGLTRLVAEGLAVRIPHRGVRVAALPLEDIVDVYTMRALLEGLAAELAAARLTPGQLDRLRELAAQDSGRYPPGPLEHSKPYREFHEIVAQAAGRRYLAQIISQLRAWAEPSLILTRDDPVLQRRFHQDAQPHANIVAAFEARDGAAARQIMTENIMTFCRNLQEIYTSDLAGQNGATEAMRPEGPPP